MDLKYNLAQAWLLRDRSPLPVTTLEVIKDFPEFVAVASSEHLERSILILFFFNQFFTCMKGGTSALPCYLGFSGKNSFLFGEKPFTSSGLDDSMLIFGHTVLSLTRPDGSQDTCSMCFSAD